MTFINFNNTYATLPEHFYAQSTPEKVPAPKLIHFNNDLAKELQIQTGPTKAEELAEYFSGNQIPPGARPISLAYAGHQFGHFVPQLGDGRACLLGEVLSGSGDRFDIQLKGSGRTYFSRGGDGKSPLGPVIREYIISEFMNKLGVPTTRSLAMVETGESVVREASHPGGILTRVASSHMRVGTFEFFACRDDKEALKVLADYAIDRHYSAIKNEEGNLYCNFVVEVAKKQLALVAQWMSLGFIHGVMNTDNMAISGETIDYGPCAFMDQYSHNKVFSSIDSNGRYAFNNQGNMAQWNIVRLAETLIPLVDTDEQKAVEKLQEALSFMPDFFKQQWCSFQGPKLGLIFNSQSQPHIHSLLEKWYQYLHDHQYDFTVSFQEIANYLGDSQENGVSSRRKWFEETTSFQELKSLWIKQVREQVGLEERALELMKLSNPLRVPRNHMVEKVIQKMEKKDDSLCKQMLVAMDDPFSADATFEQFDKPPEDSEKVCRTFCGT
jgi:serine/tyrosine/threonine adenylyltransferase